MSKPSNGSTNRASKGSSSAGRTNQSSKDLMTDDETTQPTKELTSDKSITDTSIDSVIESSDEILLPELRYSVSAPGEASTNQAVRETVAQGFMTGDEVRERLGITRGQMISLAKRGHLKRDPRRRGSFGSYVYREDDVENILKKKKVVQKLAERNTEKLDKLTRASTQLHPAHISMTAPYLSEHGLLVFDLLNKGTRIVDIVIQTGIHPAAVMTIAKDYSAAEEAMLIPADVMARIRLLPLSGSGIRRPEDIEKFVAEAAHGRFCRRCKPSKKPAIPFCGACATEAVHVRDAKRAALAKSQGPAEPEDSNSEAPDDMSNDRPSPT